MPPVKLGGPAAAIDFGFSHACTRLVGGAVRCFGTGSYGRLGHALGEINIGDNEHPNSVAPVKLF